MLKKLFVGLLILSALTTEAIAVYPLSLVMYLYPSGLLGTIPGEGVLSNDIEATGHGKVMLSSTFSGRIKKLTFNIGKLKLISTTIGLNPLYLRDYPSDSCTVAYFPTVARKDRDSAFHKSGLSPPFLAVSC